MAKVGYSEPDDYFPKDIRKQFKLGEYAEEEPEKKEKKDRDITNEEFREYIKNGK